MSNSQSSSAETSGTLSRLTREYYDDLVPDLAEEYIDFRWKSGPVQRSHYHHTRLSVERAFTDHVGSVDRLLEIGCGPGTWTDVCVRHSRETVLLDISSEMLKRAKQRLGDVRNVQYLRADFGGNESADLEKFDAIFSARAIEYMDDKAEVVGKCRRLLRSGGRLVLVTKNPRWLDKRFDERRKSTSGDVSASREATIQTGWIHWSDLAGLLAENGFEVISVSPVAIGSYRGVLSSRAGVACSNLLFRLLGRRQMSRLFDPVCESYMVVARPVERGSP